MGQKWGVRNGPPYPLKGGMYYKDASYFEKYREENRENSESNKNTSTKRLRRVLKFRRFLIIRTEPKKPSIIMRLMTNGIRGITKAISTSVLKTPKSLNSESRTLLGKI